MWLPANFADFHEGLGATWRHSRGQWFRNDYVGLPMDWVIGSCKSWVATNIDVGLAKEDHRAAVVHVRCTMRPQGLHRRPHMCKLASLHVDADSIAAIAKPAWKFDVHSHAAMIQQGIQTPAGKLLCQRQPGSYCPRKESQSQPAA